MPPECEILTRNAIRDRYPEFFSSTRKLSLERENVPINLRVLIPYVEIWGVPDDIEREGVLLRSPKELRNNLKTVVDVFSPAFDAWLADPDAFESEPTFEYVAFSAFRMGVDFL